MSEVAGFIALTAFGETMFALSHVFDTDFRENFITDGRFLMVAAAISRN